MDHWELLAGIVASTVANFCAHPPKKPYAPRDFMPGSRSEKVPRRNKKAEAAKLRAFLMSQVKLKNA